MRIGTLLRWTLDEQSAVNVILANGHGGLCHESLIVFRFCLPRSRASGDAFRRSRTGAHQWPRRVDVCPRSLEINFFPTVSSKPTRRPETAALRFDAFDNSVANELMPDGRFRFLLPSIFHFYFPLFCFSLLLLLFFFFNERFRFRERVAGELVVKRFTMGHCSWPW